MELEQVIDARVKVKSKKRHKTRDLNELSRKHEILNSITHGIGALLSVAGLIVLMIFSARSGEIRHIVSYAIYGTTLILLYSASFFYHSSTDAKYKEFFNFLDHSCIFLLIAGTYTPITLIALNNTWGWTIFGLIWGFAILGILYKVFFINGSRIVSVLIYVAMGWMCIIGIKPIITLTPKGTLLMLLIGGIFYSSGTFFYLYKKIPYNHAIWHLFVLTGSIFHFLGFMLYMT